MTLTTFADRLAEIMATATPDVGDDELDEDAPVPCHICGDTETVELHGPADDPREQSITVCATCGSDE